MRIGILVLALAGCASARFDSEATPVIVVAPGLADRIALMDAYRLNDTREQPAPSPTTDESTGDEDTDEAPR